MNNQPASTWAYDSNLQLACTVFAGCNIVFMYLINILKTVELCNTLFSRSLDSETYFNVRSVSYEKYNPGVASSACNKVLKYVSSFFCNPPFPGREQVL